jgi:hypothetical protein
LISVKGEAGDDWPFSARFDPAGNGLNSLFHLTEIKTAD